MVRVIRVVGLATARVARLETASGGTAMRLRDRQWLAAMASFSTSHRPTKRVDCGVDPGGPYEDIAAILDGVDSRLCRRCRFCPEGLSFRRPTVKVAGAPWGRPIRLRRRSKEPLKHATLASQASFSADGVLFLAGRLDPGIMALIVKSGRWYGTRRAEEQRFW